MAIFNSYVSLPEGILNLLHQPKIRKKTMHITTANGRNATRSNHSAQLGRNMRLGTAAMVWQHNRCRNKNAGKDTGLLLNNSFTSTLSINHSNL